MTRRLAMRRPLGASAAAADRRGEFNRELFDALAPVYDRQNRWVSFGRDAAWKDAMVGALPAFERPCCVDLGCGTGDIAGRLAARFPDGRVIGVDASVGMLDVARRREPSGRIEWRVADMTATGLPDRCADIVTGAYALRLCAGAPAGLAEAARLLRPGGVAAFLDFARPDSPAGFAALLGLLYMWGALAGLAFHRSLRVYTWIPATLRHMPPRTAFVAEMRRRGFDRIRRRSFFFGAVDLWTARRADEPTA